MMPLKRKMGLYEKTFKRGLDIICSIFAIIGFSWLYAIIALLVRIKMGSPVLFKQPRPGLIGKDGKEQIFDMYKFRTMSDARDENGDLLPDSIRLGKFGRMLRSTSLDELPEIFNILKGDMSLIGPRPQLVRDMVFMTDKQRMRHTARPGLSGLAQVMGRNAITWDEKINWDLKYIENVSIKNDFKILLCTVKKVLFHIGGKENSLETDLALDYGDELYKDGKVSKDRYDQLQAVAKQILSGRS